MKKKQTILCPGLLALVIIAGCAGAPRAARPLRGKIPLAAGVTIVMRNTFLGLGAGPRPKDDVGTRFVRIRKVDGENLSLEWSAKVKKARRKAPGSKVRYEAETQAGSLEVAPGPKACGLLLPIFWKTGSQRETATRAIWLTKAVLLQLRSRRKTPWRVGFLENPIAGIAQVSADVAAKLRAARKQLLAGARKQKRNLYTLDADPSGGRFSLMIDGAAVEVRTIEAHNWFGRYTILDDPENPLVLKVTFNPLSSGALDVFSPTGLLKTVMGYQVVEISTK